MISPSFWYPSKNSFMAALLSPFENITAYVTRRRLQKRGWKASVPVICCGNLTVGGSGKTTIALALGRFCLQYHIQPAFLTRGYGRKNRKKTPFQVDLKKHSVEVVGDEALLLAQVAPTWVCADRAKAAQAAIQHGAELLIMDDGFQNPTLYQDLPLLIIDGVAGFGNGHLLPAGPLREPIQSGIRRAKAIIMIGEDRHHLFPELASKLPVFYAFLKMNPEIKKLATKKVVAFAGIGRPEKFFQSLHDAGVYPVQTVAFPDHYNYRSRDLAKLAAVAFHHQAVLLTTPKDYVRLPSTFKKYVTFVDVTLQWQNPNAVSDLMAFLGLKL